MFAHILKISTLIALLRMIQNLCSSLLLLRQTHSVFVLPNLSKLAWQRLNRISVTILKFEYSIIFYAAVSMYINCFAILNHLRRRINNLKWYWRQLIYFIIHQFSLIYWISLKIQFNALHLFTKVYLLTVLHFASLFDYFSSALPIHACIKIFTALLMILLLLVWNKSM